VGLTSLALIAVLAALAAGMLVALLWGWSRLARRGLLMVAARVGALAVFELTVLALIFAVVNRSGDFYSSWSDLFGTDTGTAPITLSPAGAGRSVPGATARPVTVTGASQVPVAGRRPTRVQAGRVLAVRLHGQLSGLTVPGYVYLPPGYSASRSPLPVLVVISDQIPSAAAAYGASRLAATAATEIRAGRLRPLILVMVPARIGSDASCLNVPGGPQAATFFTQDLAQAIGSAFRAASPLSRRWGLLGGASGGYCTVQLALTSAATYAAAAAPAGSYPVPPGASATGGSPQLASQDNLGWLLHNRPMQPVSVLFTGRGAAPLAALARPPMHAQTRALPGGRYPLAPVLDWLGRQLAAATIVRS